MITVGFYDTKPYDTEYFNLLNEQYGFTIKYIEAKLNENTVMLSCGCDAVCAFVSDDVSSRVIEKMSECGVKLIAMRCAGYNNVDIKFIKSDLFLNISGKFDAVVSNPPYIVKSVIPTLMPQVKDYEPLTALDGGIDGLDFYRRITADAQNHLNNGGLLAFETGYDQGESVSALMRENGFKNIGVIKDLAGLDRVVTGIFK